MKLEGYSGVGFYCLADTLQTHDLGMRLKPTLGSDPGANVMVMVDGCELEFRRLDATHGVWGVYNLNLTADDGWMAVGAPVALDSSGSPGLVYDVTLRFDPVAGAYAVFLNGMPVADAVPAPYPMSDHHLSLIHI